MELCKQQRLRPLPVICVTMPHTLDFTTDRIKMDDWGPILNSLSLDRSLKSISVHSRLQVDFDTFYNPLFIFIMLFDFYALFIKQLFNSHIKIILR